MTTTCCAGMCLTATLPHSHPPHPTTPHQASICTLGAHVTKLMATCHNTMAPVNQLWRMDSGLWHTVYPKKYAHGFVVLCFVVVMQSFIMNSHEVFIHIHQGCFAGTGAIVILPQCQWSKPDGYGKISQCITTTKHSKAKTVCIFLGIYCTTREPSEWLFSHSWKLDPNYTARQQTNTWINNRPLHWCI